MPWVSRHRRRLPHSFFRTTTVQSHHRRRPGSVPIVPIAIAAGIMLLIILLF